MLNQAFIGLAIIGSAFGGSLRSRELAAVVVDGNMNDWSSGDFYKNMYNAGDPDKAFVAKAYTKMDCTTNKFCILVEAEAGYVLAEDDTAWFRDDATGRDTIPGDIKFVKVDGLVKGWEGCFTLPAEADSKKIEIHANWGTVNGPTGNTTSTGKIAQNKAQSITYPTCLVHPRQQQQQELHP